MHGLELCKSHPREGIVVQYHENGTRSHVVCLEGETGSSVGKHQTQIGRHSRRVEARGEEGVVLTGVEVEEGLDA